MSDELHVDEVLRDEYVRLHGQDPPPDAGAQAANLKNLFAAIHGLKTPRTALCISGGGIRSATYALGVIQRLAKLGVLTQFDYLSTVSGGGYIGSWLSSYARRNQNGIAGVAAELSGGARTSGDPLKPEAEPLTWLRRFSNYLTPKLGLLSGDTWAFVGSYLRNLVLVWLMFVPLLVAALAIPRLCVALLRACGDPTPYAIVGGVVMIIATTMLSFTRPVSYRTRGLLTNGLFLGVVFVPFLIASICIALCWALLYDKNVPWLWIGIAMVAISGLSSIVYNLRFMHAVRSERLGNIRDDSSKTGYIAKKFLHETVAALVAGAAATALLYAAAAQLFQNPMTKVELPTLASWKVIPPTLTTAPGESFLCFAVPLILGILFLQSAIFVGGASWFNEEYDREWWGRAGGWVLVAGIVWIVFTSIAVYGPVAIFQAPRVFAAVGTASGLAAILIGRSGKTAANQKEEETTAGPMEIATNLSLGVVAPIFVVAIAALLSLTTSEVMWHVSEHPAVLDTRLASHGTYEIAFNETLPQGTANFRTPRFPAVEKDKLSAMQHLWVFDHTTLRQGLILVIGFVFVGVIVSFFIGANQFSMHGLYRNRLIRAYLGASRGSHRIPNAFSGFDPNDNVAMHQLRPEMLWKNSFLDIEGLAVELRKDSTLTPYIEAATWAAIATIPAKPPSMEARLQAGDLLADDLNHAMEDLDLDRDPKNAAVPKTLRNRRYLEAKFPGHFVSVDVHKRPLHIVNMALNLVTGKDLAWQERKAASFPASPMYTGNLALGYQRTRNYGGPSGLSLGTAVAISGAFASPNMGYHSSPALSFLLTLFNVRLGWWLGNPRFPTYQYRNPKNSLVPFLAESFGYTNEEFPYIYLSDGGHFDNLGLYEMVLRRVGCIVVSDAGNDPSFGFEDLGNAIRKIRVDFGINITIDRKMGLHPRSKEDPSNPKYCAIGTIHYEQVDPNGKPGKLLYIKPAFYGEREPKDVYNYAVTNPTFPHQSTGDQWFSESQFESYRQLGDFMLCEITGNHDHFDSICELIDAADRYLDAADDAT